LWSAFSTIFREEGYRGLYRGMGAHLIRVAPNAAIMFAVYEGLVRYGGTYLLKEEQESIFEEDGTDH
jgi:solute carrier family 25 protein 33/36